MVAKLSREHAYRKALEVFDTLPAIGLMPDTAITNAAISACDKGKGFHDSLEEETLDSLVVTAFILFLSGTRSTALLRLRRMTVSRHYERN